MNGNIKKKKKRVIKLWMSIICRYSYANLLYLAIWYTQATTWVKYKYSTTFLCFILFFKILNFRYYIRKLKRIYDKL